MFFSRLEIIFFILLLSLQAKASTGISNARALAMADAYGGLALGAEAPFANPANLSIHLPLPWSITLFGIGMGAVNNSFSKSYYDRYNGQYLDQYAKDDILRAIPSQGVKTNAVAEMQTLSIGYGSFAFSASLSGVGDGRIPREMFKMLLEEVNTPLQTYSFEPGRFGATAYAAFSFSYGFPLRFKLPYVNHLGVGFTARYIRGYFYSRMSQSHVQMITLFSQVMGDGYLKYNQAMGGHGMGIDAGIVATVARRYRISVFIKNLFQFIKWNNVPEEHFYSFQLNPTNLDEIIAQQNVNDSLVSSDSSYALPPFSTRAPAVIKIGAVRSFGQFVLGGQWQINSEYNVALKKALIFSVGSEYRPLGWLRLRGGISHSNLMGMSFSYGLGFILKRLRWDFGGRSYGGLLPKQQRGLLVATSLILRF